MTPRQYDRLKRLLDVVGAAVLAILVLPLMVVAAAMVAVTLGRPVLFRQVRPGLHCAPFVIVKFRTMRTVDDRAGPVSDEHRLTAVGRLLRATSVDELPSLWNVVRGEMSLVGPRPLMVEYLDRYDAVQARRHEVQPGITGLAQVRGRNALSWEDKFTFDVWYVDHRCLSVDLRILIATVGAVLRRTGISADGVATAPEFMGSSVDPGR